MRIQILAHVNGCTITNVLVPSLHTSTIAIFISMTNLFLASGYLRHTNVGKKLQGIEPSTHKGIVGKDDTTSEAIPQDSEALCVADSTGRVVSLHATST